MTADTPLIRTLAAAVHANIPVILWGDPGVGKTSIVTALGQQWGRHVETIVGSIREPSDFMGLPVETGGTVTYAPLAWAQRLADADQGLLFLDELTTAAPSVQRAMLRILQEREVGELTLPGSVSIVAAANPPDIAVDGYDLAAPVANRMCHLDWHFNVESWADGLADGFANPSPADSGVAEPSDADAARAAAAVAAFVRHRPELAVKVPTDDPAQAGRGWPSPRSWTNAASILGWLRRDDADAQMVAVTGCVGEAAATEYVAWEAAADLADPAEVLADPSIVDWSGERPDRLFATVNAVKGLAVMRGTEAAWRDAMTAMAVCAESGKPDVAAPATQTLTANPPGGQQMPERTRKAFVELFKQTGQAAA